MLNLDNIVSNKNENKDTTGSNSSERKKIKNLNGPHAFIEYSDDMDDVLDDINNYNKNRDKKVLIVFDDMIANIEYNKKN